MPKRDQILYRVIERIRILHGILHVRSIRSVIDRQIEIRRVCLRESEILTGIPLHRRAASRSEISALLGGQIFPILHADLIAVIEERDARHSENERVRELYLTLSQSLCKSRRVVVAGDEADIAAHHRLIVSRLIFFKELHDVPVAVRTEEASVLSLRNVVAEQGIHAVARMIQVEIHVETRAVDSLVGIIPLGYKCRVREIMPQSRQYIPVDSARAALILVILLDQRIRHVDAEAVTALLEPEPHHIRHSLAGRKACRVIDSLLPGLRRREPAVVESRLTFEKIQHIDAVPLGLAADIGVTFDTVENKIRPDIAVRVLILLRLRALLEPFVLLRGVTGDKVDQDFNPALVGFLKKSYGIFICPVAGRDLLVVAHVIARVFERGVIKRVDPERVASKFLNIVKLLNDADKVSDAVTVRVVERLGVNFIKHCIL